MKKTVTKKIRIATKIIGMFALTSTLLFSGCAKDGAIGPAGTDGVDGNANVKSKSFTQSSWTYSAPYLSLNLNYPAITQSIIDNGAVLVYLKDGSNDYQLPVTFYPAANRSETYQINAYVGGVNIYISESNQTQPADPGSSTFKVVVIASSALVKNPKVNLNNYNEVKVAFNL